MIKSAEQIRDEEEYQKDVINHFVNKMNIEDHQFKGYNRSLGVHVNDVDHYKKLLLDGGYVPCEEAMKIALNNNKGRKEYKPSSKLVSFLRHLYSKRSGKNGEIQLGSKEIQAMKDLGVKFDVPQEHLV